MGQKAADSIRSVLVWYRAHLTGRRTTAVVPEELAGWVLAGPGEPSEEDGYRPLGAVRDLLERLTEASGLSDAARTAVRSEFGLSGYPSRHPARPLALRVSPVRRRGAEGLGTRRLRDLVKEATDAMDATLHDVAYARPGQRAAAPRPVPEPSTSPWFLARTDDAHRFRILVAAVDAARVFVATTGRAGEADEVLAELEQYEHTFTSRDQPLVRPAGRSRARAVVGLQLWEVTRPARSTGSFEPADSGIVVPPAAFSVIGGAIGAFIAGSRESPTVLAACAETLALAEKDREAANVVADLLVGVYRHGRDRRLSGDAYASILRTVVRIRAHDEDPTAIGLALRARADHGDHWLTVDTLQAAVRVASAYERWDLALWLCREASVALSAQFKIPAGRERHIERIEYQAWTHHQETATLRRMADAGAGNEPFYEGLEIADKVDDCFDQAQAFHQRGEPGDVSSRWDFYFHVRRAELHLATEQHTGGVVARRHRNAASRARDAAAALAKAHGIEGEPLIPLLKIDLLLSLSAGDGEGAAETLWRMHRLGWPIRRSVAAVVPLVTGTGPAPEAPPPLLEAVQDIATAEVAGNWSAAADDRGRRRRERLAAS